MDEEWKDGRARPAELSSSPPGPERRQPGRFWKQELANGLHHWLLGFGLRGVCG